MSKRYNVVVNVQYPAWNERDGIVFYDITATSKADAIREARRENAIGGQIHREQGRATWRAVELTTT